MSSLSAFLNNFDFEHFVAFILNGVAVLFCITLHELAHGYTAYHLGDPTAKEAGRLTLNPIKHIDVFGLLMMLVAKVGWAKAVPVDMRNFKRPKRDMALTALAGPVANFLLALISVGILSVAYHVWRGPAIGVGDGVLLCLKFLANLAVLSVGLGIFNLVPIPPLDGSKLLFSLLPEKLYYTVLRYERYIMGIVLLLAFSGVLSEPLSWVISAVCRGLCVITGCPDWFLSFVLNYVASPAFIYR